MTKIRLDELKAALEKRRPAGDRSEADYKRKLVAEINRLPEGYARRIEDRFAVGVLDMIIKLPDKRIFFAEGKVIDGNLFGPSERQYHEGLRLQAAHIWCLLIGWKHGAMYVSEWVEKVDCRECFTLAGRSGAEILQEYVK
jgi:hypothetical protein